jgi:hypothetical protein
MHYFNKSFSPNFGLREKLELISTEFHSIATQTGRIMARKEKNLSNLKARATKERQAEISNKKRLDSECYTLNQKHRALEMERKQNSQVLAIETQRYSFI